ncbi:MAG: glycoside hydrolase family 65 protein [Candidatus Omnitrophica bacterium]|nr:glycoside hydrolase family 65 protein [Candidatus Omnitrophota bacterium]
MSSWKIIYQNFNPEEEKLREALCTLGNGYFATRGAQPEAFDSESHYPGTYVAGGYNKIGTPLAGRTIYNEDLVNCPNWLIIRFKIDNGEWVTLSSSTILSYRQELDMHRGILTRNTRLKSKDGKITTVETCRIVSMANPHVAAMKYVITPENYEGRITIQSMLDGTVINNGVARYRQLRSKHLIPWSVQTFDRDGISLSVKTSQSNIYISQACRIKIFVNNKKMRTRCEIIKKNKGKIYQECTFFVKKKKSYAVEKIVSLFTSKDSGIKNYRHAAISVFKKQHTFTALLKEHVRAWKTLWEMFDIKITGDAFAQKVLRLHMFHLIQTASKHSITVDAGMPARGLHGEAYRGHIFWDELFIMPLYDFHVPEISKSLLMYRYRRLGQARKYAKKYGYNGAMFPWQSGSSGVEETQIVHLNPLSGKWGPDYSSIQRHISFAIAYNVWQYWQRTGDKSFFIRYGAEMILSIAQFVSSLAKYDQKKGRYYTEGIMGPDEFHEQLPGSKKHGLKNNSYSNVFMVWTLRKALETINAIISPHEKGRLLRKLNITQKELSRWMLLQRKWK